MEKTIIVETNDDFESCDDCVHSGDAEGCIHAILDDDTKECYQPKLSTKRRKEKE